MGSPLRTRPDGHTGGRHRRWTAGDVARLERMCALTATGLPPAEAARLARGEEPPAVAPAGETAAGARRPPSRSRAGSGLSLGDVRQECKGVARAALRLDAAALDRLLLDAITEHGLVAAWTEVIVPTLQAVGRKWQTSGERYVEVEHFLSWHVSGVLRRTTPDTVADRPGSTVVLACVPGENHTLALEVLSAALAQRAFRCACSEAPCPSSPSSRRCAGPGRPPWGCGRSPVPPPAGRWPSTWPPGVGRARRSPQAGRPDPRTGLGGAGGGRRGAPDGPCRGRRRPGVGGRPVTCRRPGHAVVTSGAGPGNVVRWIGGRGRGPSAPHHGYGVERGGT
ncbi:hypothetical protein GCM10023238_30370 [Streptomyces heliomycini]